MIDVTPYLRAEMMPHIWCKGCGNGIVLGALLRAVRRLGLDPDRVAMISGIGCSGRLPGYVDFNTLHTTHGRALAFATGLKLARPDLTVIVVTGDGDCLAIGGNHLIHAARRNVDVTCLLFNNQIYGMTGGQVAPTTPQGLFTTTTAYGNLEPAFDACRLVQAAGASFVARRTTYAAVALEKTIAEAIEHRGFSFLEIMTTCPEIHGRRNKLGSAAEMLKKLGKLPMPMGVLHREERPDYGASYDAVIARAQAAAAARAAAAPASAVASVEPFPLAAPYEVRLSGEGGQGVVLAGIVLAEAAIQDGRNAVQTQEYGPESRGGAATSEAILSDADIDYPRATRVDLLCALTAEAYDKHRGGVKEGGVLLADSSIAVDERPNGFAVHRLPLIETAVARTGKALAANAVALGAMLALGAPVSRRSLESALLRRIPAGTEALNRAALAAGYDLVRSAG